MRQLIHVVRRCRTQLIRRKTVAVGTIVVCGVGLGAFGVASASPVSADGGGLSTTELEAVAINASRAAGEDAPTELQAVNTTVLQGAMTLSPPSSGAPAESPEAQASLSRRAELEVLHGHFTLASASVPPGSPLPTGSVLSLVVDEETGAIVFTALNNRGPSQSSMEALGHVSVLADPAS